MSMSDWTLGLGSNPSEMFPEVTEGRTFQSGGHSVTFTVLEEARTMSINWGLVFRILAESAENLPDVETDLTVEMGLDSSIFIICRNHYDGGFSRESFNVLLFAHKLTGELHRQQGRTLVGILSGLVDEGRKIPIDDVWALLRHDREDQNNDWLTEIMSDEVWLERLMSGDFSNHLAISRMMGAVGEDGSAVTGVNFLLLLTSRVDPAELELIAERFSDATVEDTNESGFALFHYWTSELPKTWGCHDLSQQETYDQFGAIGVFSDDLFWQDMVLLLLTAVHPASLILEVLKEVTSVWPESPFALSMLLVQLCDELAEHGRFIIAPMLRAAMMGMTASNH